MHPALHSWRDELPAAIVRVLAYISAIAVVSIAAAHFFEPTKAINHITPVHRSEWIDIERPFPAFALAITEAADEPAAYTLRRHATGGGRKDILSLGEAEGAGPYLSIEIYRPGRETHDFSNPLRTVADGASALGPVALQSEDEPLASKFGPFSIATFETAQAAPRHCLGFARAAEDPPLQISGWFCQSGPGFVPRATLACALSRLTLLSSGNEPRLAALFAQAELNRRNCPERSPLMAPTPKYKALWGKTAGR
jgi:hypothetical protein